MLHKSQERRFLKLLISEMRALGRYISREFHFTVSDLIDHWGWKQMEPEELTIGDGPLASRLERRLGEVPSVILFWESYGYLVRVLRELPNLQARICIFADDLHWTSDTMRSLKLVSYVSSDVVLSAYEPVFDEFYPGLRRTKKIVWVPHAACPDFFLPFNESPRNAVLLSGKIHPVYPLRQELLKLQQSGKYAIDLLTHPGYHCRYDHRTDASVGVGYAREIHARLCGFTCSSQYHYTVAKFFEIPATGSLLLADHSVAEPLHQLGFVDYEHYVPVGGGELENGVAFVLDPANRAMLDRIRRAGQKLVVGKHTTRDRARMIDEAVSNA